MQSDITLSQINQLRKLFQLRQQQALNTFDLERHRAVIDIKVKAYDHHLLQFDSTDRVIVYVQNDGSNQNSAGRVVHVKQETVQVHVPEYEDLEHQDQVLTRKTKQKKNRKLAKPVIGS